MVVDEKFLLVPQVVAIITGFNNKILISLFINYLAIPIATQKDFLK